MKPTVLVLRPEPGNTETVERLAALGFPTVAAPLFTIEPVDWSPPDPDAFDAVLLTSANAARHGGAGLSRFCHMPTYAVGPATADAAKRAGFLSVRTGGGDAAATIPMLVADGHRHVLHPGGAQRRAFDPLGLSIAAVPVYRSRPTDAADALVARIAAAGATVALIHSPRAGERFAQLVPLPLRPTIALVAISPAAAKACGPGWRAVTIAAVPDQDAMLSRLQTLV